MTGPILLWGLPEDPGTRAVHASLAELEADVVLLDHAAIARTRARFTATPEPEHHVAVDGQTWRLEDFAAAYLRPYDVRDYEPDPAPATLARASRVHHIVCDWAQYADATIINRPAAEGTNHSKLRQAIDIHAAGFATPDSLVTNDARAILDLLDRHGSVVYKSLSSVRSVVRELHAGDLPRGPMGPVLVQQRVVGTNVRVHVVGDRTFAAAIDTDAVDYRYARAALTEIELDDELAHRCVALTRRLGLHIAGIDLIVTPRADWYCLEVNPNPGFTCFDASPDQPVARAIAELLLAPAAEPVAAGC
jgi:glutathione synthase/RimK-type ligase-like ATP-grasp enzyme